MGFYMKLPKPPSVNTLYGHNRRGFKYVSNKGQAWFEECGWLIKTMGKIEPITTECSLDIEVGYAGRYDVDNALKATLDLLEKSQVVENDGLITQLYVVKKRVKHRKDQYITIKLNDKSGKENESLE